MLAIHVLGDLSATSPHASELIAPLLETVRHTAADDVAKIATPLTAYIVQMAQAIAEINQDYIPRMGL